MKFRKSRKTHLLLLFIGAIVTVGVLLLISLFYPGNNMGVCFIVVGCSLIYMAVVGLITGFVHSPYVLLEESKDPLRYWIIITLHILFGSIVLMKGLASALY